MVAVVLLIAAVIAIIIALVEISKLRSEVAILQSAIPEQTMNIPSLESTIEAEFIDFRNTLNESKYSVYLSFDQLISEVNNNTRSNKVLVIILDDQHISASCGDIQKLLPLSPSGYYNIRSSNGYVITAYCDMTRSCGGITGGWMRVAELDMTDNTTQCPDSLELRTTPLRTCTTVNTARPICSSDMFSVDGVQYSKVCGRIRAYQVGSPDAFGTRITDLDSYYVDGVSLTHGSSPRQHIWTFVGAGSEDDQSIGNKCPCTNTAISNMAIPPPSFVGDDYFCDTGVDIRIGRGVFYSDDPLWDGTGCGPQNTCCSLNSPPWFYKQLPQTTTDDIEMRVCRDQARIDEDIAIKILELYVQ